MFFVHEYSLSALILLGILFTFSDVTKEGAGLAERIIAMEKAALDRWGRGEPQGYLDIYADEITYFDTETEQRLDGIKVIRDLYAIVEGKIHIERYEMINPKVQIHDKTAVLTFNLIDYIKASDGSLKETKWNSTEIYSLIEGEWKIIHSHWSHIKPEEQ